MPAPKPPRKPSISKGILGFMADKGVNSRVSLTFLRNALTTAGDNMTCNKRRFKRVVKGLVDKSMLKRVTGRGMWGSFCMCKKQASKFNFKLKTKRRQQKQHRSGQHCLGSASQVDTEPQTGTQVANQGGSQGGQMPPQLMRQVRQAGSGARPPTGSAQWELKEPNLLNACLLESLGFKGVGKEKGWSTEKQ